MLCSFFVLFAEIHSLQFFVLAYFVVNAIWQVINTVTSQTMERNTNWQHTHPPTPTQTPTQTPTHPPTHTPHTHTHLETATCHITALISCESHQESTHFYYLQQLVMHRELSTICDDYLNYYVFQNCFSQSRRYLPFLWQLKQDSRQDPFWKTKKQN